MCVLKGASTCEPVVHTCILNACVCMCIPYKHAHALYENAPPVCSRACPVNPSLSRLAAVSSSNFHPRDFFLESQPRQTLLLGSNPGSLHLEGRLKNRQHYQKKCPRVGSDKNTSPLCDVSGPFPLGAVPAKVLGLFHLRLPQEDSRASGGFLCPSAAYWPCPSPAQPLMHSWG